MFRFFFHWYDGNVWGNLLASVIVAVPAYFWGRMHIKKFHVKLDKIHSHLGIKNEH